MAHSMPLMGLEKDKTGGGDVNFSDFKKISSGRLHLRQLRKADAVEQGRFDYTDSHLSALFSLHM